MRTQAANQALNEVHAELANLHRLLGNLCNIYGKLLFTKEELDEDDVQYEQCIEKYNELEAVMQRILTIIANPTAAMIEKHWDYVHNILVINPLTSSDYSIKQQLLVLIPKLPFPFTPLIDNATVYDIQAEEQDIEIAKARSLQDMDVTNSPQVSRTLPGHSKKSSDEIQATLPKKHSVAKSLCKKIQFFLLSPPNKKQPDDEAEVSQCCLRLR